MNQQQLKPNTRAWTTYKSEALTVAGEHLTRFFAEHPLIGPKSAEWPQRVSDLAQDLNRALAAIANDMELSERHAAPVDAFSIGYLTSKVAEQSGAPAELVLAACEQFQQAYGPPFHGGVHFELIENAEYEAFVSIREKCCRNFARSKADQPFCFDCPGPLRGEGEHADADIAARVSKAETRLSNGRLRVGEFDPDQTVSPADLVNKASRSSFQL